MPAAAILIVRDAAAMNLSEIASLVGGELLGSDVKVDDLTYSSNSVEPGSLFVCINGDIFDGHDFASEAIARGSVGLMCERTLPINAPQVIVSSARDSMNRLASRFFGDPSKRLSVVGVTGTNGKTTTTYMIDSITRASGSPSGMIGTVEVRVGDASRPGIRTTPESIDLQRIFADMVANQVKTCAIEVTSEGIEAGRIEGITFAVGVFTNLTQDHLNAHGTMENYFNAKKKLFEVDRTSIALVNADDEWGRRLIKEISIPTLTFGISHSSDIRAEGVQLGHRGTHFRIVGNGNFGDIDELFFTPIPGLFNVYNALGACAAAILVGLDEGSIVYGLNSLKGVPGRFEPVDAGQEFSVVVDYAHTPDSLRNVLIAARDLTTKRVITVIGCGGDRDKGKRPQMGKIAAELSDRVFITSDNPRSEEPMDIIRQIEMGVSEHPGASYVIEADRALAIFNAVEDAEPGDVVVIAGKGHELGQEFKDHKIPFDDRQVAAAAIRSLSESGGR